MSIAKTALKGVVYHDREKASDGYNLFAGRDNDIYLMNMDGEIVHKWWSPYTPSEHMELLPNGNLLCTGHYRNTAELGLAPMFAAMGGILLELDWESNLVWKLEVPYQHHDFAVDLATDNIIYPTYHPDGVLPEELASEIKGGMEGSEFEGKVWGDIVYEVNRSGEVVWEWKAKDHLDPLLDILNPIENRMICPYINSVDICRNGDLLLSARHLSTIFRIDRKTGKIIARYGRDFLHHQHDARELDNGNILVFNNGIQSWKYDAHYSRVQEIDPATDSVVWEYIASPEPTDFYSPITAGSSRLRNGNTLIWESVMGRIFEVTPLKEIVWEYINPIYVFNLGIDSNKLWRVHHYYDDYPGLSGKVLDSANWPLENDLFGPPAFVTSFKPIIL